MTGNMMIATILQRDPQNLRECVAMWRQLSDIVAQRGMQLNQCEIQQSLRTLARLRNKVPEQVRRDTALSVAHHGRFAPLVALYANDTVMVAAAMLQNAQLPEDDWLALLPATNDVARSILANRDDLPSAVRRALSSLGAGSVALPSGHVSAWGVAASQADRQEGRILTPAATAVPTPISPPTVTPAPPTTAFFADEQPMLDRQHTWRTAYQAERERERVLVQAKVEAAALARNSFDDPNPITAPAAGFAKPAALLHSLADIDSADTLSQISELVRRIDRFQSSRHAPDTASHPGSAPHAPNPEAPAAPAFSTSPLHPPVPDEILTALRSISADLRSKFTPAPAQDLDHHAAFHPDAARDAASDRPPPVPEIPQGAAPPAEFRFYTDSDGVIDYVDGVPPALVIGMSIAIAAVGAAPGTDGAAAGAFRQHAEIVHAHMRLGGESDAAGEWRFSAEPIFDRRTGQFQGYRALARRPLFRDKPYGQSDHPETSDSIRQLIHELRSPLNAISGFAQIISAQMFGPVSDAYRTMADSIIDDAANVQSIIEDLDTAAGHVIAQTPPSSDQADVADIGEVVDYVTNDLQMLLADQQVGLSITREGGPFLARTDVGNARRMIGRLLTALIDVSEADSLIVGQLIADLTGGDMMQIRFVRPSTIRFADAAQLLDPGYSPEGEAPAADILSLGFSLRLVGSLAGNCGGKLEITSNAIILHLPLATSDIYHDKPQGVGMSEGVRRS